MRIIRVGLVGALLAASVSLGLVVSAVPAQAWDTSSNTPPPRVTAVPGTTTPKTFSFSTSSTLPKWLLGGGSIFGGVLGWLIPFLGYGGATDLNGCTTTLSNGIQMQCVPGSPEQQAWDAAHAPGSPKVVAPITDSGWCAVNSSCGGGEQMISDGAQALFFNLSHGSITYSDLTVANDSFVKVGTRTWTLGAKCNSYSDSTKPAQCKIPSGTTRPVTDTFDSSWPSPSLTARYAGMCQRKSDGYRQGLKGMNYGSYANKGVGEWRTGLSAAGQSGDSLANLGGSSAGTQYCDTGFVLQWLRWQSDPINASDTSTRSYPGHWVNPAYDPSGTTVITSNLTCARTTGDHSQTVTVTNSGPAGTGYVPEVTCPAGYTPTGGSMDIGSDFLPSPKRVETWTLDPMIRETYPECIGWDKAGCTLRIQLDGVDCTAANLDCANWQEIWMRTPSRIKCMWGPYQMDVQKCLQPLRNEYVTENGQRPDYKLSPDASPLSTDPYGNTYPSNNPDPYGAPSTGTDPSAGGSTMPGPAEIPGWGTSPAPGTGGAPTTAPGGGTAPYTSDANCWPSGTAAFNPLEWVLQPVKCALQWAFVPRTTVAEQQFSRMQGSIGKVGVVAAAGSVSSVFAVLGASATGSGCSGPAVNFDMYDVHMVLHPFDACSGPTATAASISYAFTTVVTVVFGILGVVRALGSALGWNFTMGRGGGS